MLPQKKTLSSWLPTIIGEFIGNDYVSRHFDHPPINIIDTDKQYIVEIAAPGIAREHFNIDLLGDNQLKIKIEGKKCDHKEDSKGERYLRKEFCCFEFEQTLILPENIDKEAISARKHDGILKIEIPKKTKEINLNTAKKIEIK